MTSSKHLKSFLICIQSVLLVTGIGCGSRGNKETNLIVKISLLFSPVSHPGVSFFGLMGSYQHSNQKKGSGLLVSFPLLISSGFPIGGGLGDLIFFGGSDYSYYMPDASKIMKKKEGIGTSDPDE